MSFIESKSMWMYQEQKELQSSQSGENLAENWQEGKYKAQEV